MIQAQKIKLETKHNSVGLRNRTGLRVGMKLGDALENAFKVTGLNRFAYLYTQITGKDCGCEARKEFLNRLF